MVFRFDVGAGVVIIVGGGIVLVVVVVVVIVVSAVVVVDGGVMAVIEYCFGLCFACWLLLCADGEVSSERQTKTKKDRYNQ